MMRRIAAALMMIALLIAASSCERNITPDANGRV